MAIHTIVLTSEEVGDLLTVVEHWTQRGCGLRQLAGIRERLLEFQRNDAMVEAYDSKPKNDARIDPMTLTKNRPQYWRDVKPMNQKIDWNDPTINERADMARFWDDDQENDQRHYTSPNED